MRIETNKTKRIVKVIGTNIKIDSELKVNLIRLENLGYKVILIVK